MEPLSFTVTDIDTSRSWSDSGSRPKLVVDLLGSLKNFTPKTMLDLGCGDGSLSKSLMDKLGLVSACGVDILPSSITLTIKGLNFTRCDFNREKLPFGDSEFDFIHLGDVLEHLFYPDRILDEIHRVLSSSGLCIITIPNLAAWPSRIALLLGYYPYQMSLSPDNQGVGKLWLKSSFTGQWGHIRVPTLRALTSLLRIHDFDIVRVKGLYQGSPEKCLDTRLSILPSMIGILDKFISNTWPSLAPGIAVIVRKNEVR
jgi:SAM-dependent methyltransferase